MRLVERAISLDVPRRRRGRVSEIRIQTQVLIHKKRKQEKEKKRKNVNGQIIFPIMFPMSYFSVYPTYVTECGR